MPTYVSESVEIEAKQWKLGGSDDGLRVRAELIVAWVNANGGEARYVHNPSRHVDAILPGEGPRIMVRTNSGWAAVAPGWWVIKGSETFNVGSAVDYTVLLDHYPVRDLSEVRVPLTWTEKT